MTHRSVCGNCGYALKMTRKYCPGCGKVLIKHAAHKVKSVLRRLRK